MTKYTPFIEYLRCPNHVDGSDRHSLFSACDATPIVDHDFNPIDYFCNTDDWCVKITYICTDCGAIAERIEQNLKEKEC